MKIVMGIQARMGSHRLPGKVAKILYKNSLLEHLLSRATLTLPLNHIHLLTSTNLENDTLEEIARKYNVKAFRGSEDDVLSRFLHLIHTEGADHVIRVCADSPILDVAEVHFLINQHIEKNSDYSFNHIPTTINGYPNGIGAEIFKAESFINVVKSKLVSKIHKEHISTIFSDFSNNFRIHQVIANKSFFGHQFDLDIDTTEDFSRLSFIFEQLYDDNPTFGIRDIVQAYNSKKIPKHILIKNDLTKIPTA